MPILFITNSTKQNAIYSYRTGFADPNHPVPANHRLVNVPCPAGGHVRLMEGKQDDLSVISMQLMTNGAVEVSDLSRRQIDIIPAILSYDKPVDVDKVRSVIERNSELENDNSFRHRKNLAIATHYNMNQLASEMGPDAPRPHNFVQTVEEVARPGEEAGNVEVIEVATEGHEPVANKGRRGRRAA